MMDSAGNIISSEYIEESYELITNNRGSKYNKINYKIKQEV